MSTLAEIEAAVAALPQNEKRELLLFVTEKLRGTGATSSETGDLSKAVPSTGPDFIARAKAIWGETPAGLPLSTVVSEARGAVQ